MTAVLEEVLFDLSVTGSGVAWQLARMRATERLSELFECEVEAVPLEAIDDLAALPGKPASLKVTRGAADHSRHFTGVVSRVVDRGQVLGQRVVALTIVPSLWLLGQRTDGRIFQDMTADAIIKEVLRDAGVYQGDGAQTWKIANAELSPREYCTQYNESDLDFVRRLLEEEGLTFRFDSKTAADKLIVVDGGADHIFDDYHGGAAVSVMGSGGATFEHETVRSIEDEREVVASTVVLRDHDFTRPDFNLHQRAHDGDGNGTLYEYPSRANLHEYDTGAKQYGADDARRFASSRLEEARGGRARMRARSNLVTLAPGDVVHVLREDASAAQPSLVLAVEHRGESNDLVLTSERGDTFDRYANDFDAVPGGTPVRPSRVTRRPRALAPQVAVVTAASEGSADTINTDPYGRVLVRFRWDWSKQRAPAYAAGSTRSSCWLRVSQPWAGAGFGVVFTPRAGTEVLVQFIDGDPDRPVVTGCLYNGTHLPPLELDREKSRSVIRTQSTNGNGYNELLFEDLADKELVSLRAQRDLKVDALHDRTLTVKNDDTTVVEKDAALTVKGKHRIAVTGDRTTELKARETVTVDGDVSMTVHGGASSQVAGEHKLSADEGFTVKSGGNSKATLAPDGATLKAAEITVTATQKLTLQCGGNVIEISPSGIKIATADGTSLTLQPAMATLKNATGAKVALEGPQATLSSPVMTVIQGTLVKIN